MTQMVETLVKACVPWYAFVQAPRYYHNYEHAEGVVQAIHELTDNPSDELILAGWYHDAVYIPGAGLNANELCSGAALKTEYNKIPGHTERTDRMIEKAYTLIKYTDIGTHLKENRLIKDIGILLDADLKALSLPFKDFLHNQKLIILENFGDPEKDVVKCAKFLVNFLECREFIYHTDIARDRWEKHARSNIETLCFLNNIMVPL